MPKDSGEAAAAAAAAAACLGAGEPAPALAPAGAGAGAAGPAPAPIGEPGACARRWCWCCCWCCCCCCCCCSCCCWCWCCLNASLLSSSGLRLFWRPPEPLPPAGLDAAADDLAEVGGHGLEPALLPLCPMNMRIWVYLRREDGFDGGGGAAGKGRSGRGIRKPTSSNLGVYLHTTGSDENSGPTSGEHTSKVSNSRGSSRANSTCQPLTRRDGTIGSTHQWFLTAFSDRPGRRLEM